MTQKKTWTIGELADEFQISKRTLQRYLKPHKHFFEFSQRKRFFFAKEVEFIRKLLGDIQRQE